MSLSDSDKLYIRDSDLRELREELKHTRDSEYADAIRAELAKRKEVDA